MNSNMRVCSQRSLHNLSKHLIQITFQIQFISKTNGRPFYNTQDYTESLHVQAISFINSFTSEGIHDIFQQEVIFSLRTTYRIKRTKSVGVPSWNFKTKALATWSPLKNLIWSFFYIGLRYIQSTFKQSTKLRIIAASPWNRHLLCLKQSALPLPLRFGTPHQRGNFLK